MRFASEVELGLDSTIFLGNLIHSAGGSEVFRAGNNLLGCVSHFHGDNIGFSAFAPDYPDSPVISSVRHPLVNRRLEKDCDFLSWLIDPQNPAQSDLSSLAGLLSKESSRPRPITFRPSH